MLELFLIVSVLLWFIKKKKFNLFLFRNDTENDQTVQVNDFEKDNPPRKKRKLSDDSNDGSFSKKKDSKSV